MTRHTKYIQNMISEIEGGATSITSPDKKVKMEIRKYKIDVTSLYECEEPILVVLHYDYVILRVAFTPIFRNVGLNGNSFEIGIDAYSVTDARIINQVLEEYVPGYVAHSRKGEVIVD